MAIHDPREESPKRFASSMLEPYAQQWLAVRVAGIYLIAGLLWIGISDLTLAESGGLTAVGFLVSAGKGAIFVVLSAGLVFWLCRREYRNTFRSMALLRAVVEGTSDAVFVKDRDGRYLMVNSAAAHFIGKEVSEILGCDDRQLFEASEAERLMENDRRIMLGGRVVTLEERLTSSGLTRTYQATKAPFFDANDALAGLIGISRNVTDSARIESVLRETDTRLREAQRIARLGSWSWEPATNRVWWSEAEFELIGVDPAETSPSFEAFLAMLHPEDRKIAVARVEAMLAGDNEFANDLRVMRSDGTCLWIHSQARATRDASGTLVRVEGTDQDITAQRTAQDAARESERRLQAAIEVAELGIIEVDYESQTASLSPRAAEQFGLNGKTTTRAELHARFHPADENSLASLIESALDPAGSGCFAVEHRVARPDGTTRWLNVRQQVTFVDDIPSSALVVTADVTARRQAELSLREQEMLVREATELSKVGGWGFDPVTMQIDWTAEVANIYGSPSDPPPNIAEALNAFTPEQRLELEKALAAATQDGIPQDMELQLIAIGGQKKWVRAICRPIVENGRVVRVRGSLQDITDRKRVESELRASEERYRMLFDSNPHPMWVYDVDTLQFLAVNDAAIQAYGYTQAEFLSMTIRDIRPAEDVAKLEADISRTARGLYRSDEWRHRCKDGTVLAVEISSHDLPFDQGHSRLVLALDITDRKRAEAELLASERRLRLLLEAAGAIAFAWDIPNDTVTRYFSREPALPATGEQVGTLDEVRSIIHPRDLSFFDARLAACLAAGSEYRNEYRVVRPDGSTANLEEYGFLDRTSDGSPLLLTGMSIDVTDRLAATESLRISEERLRVALKGARGVWDWDLVTGLAWWSPEMYELMGAPPNLVKDEAGSVALIYEDDRARVHAAVADAICRRADYHCEFRVLGGTRWLSSQASISCDAEGNPIRLVGITWDITERVRADEALRLSESKYRQLVEVLRSVLDSVDDAILTVDDAGTVTSFNQSTERMFGYHEEELLGTNVFRLVPDLSGDRNDRHVNDYMRTNQARTLGIGREVQGRRKVGTTFPAELTITEFLRDGRHEFTWVLRDITARRQLEEQFRQSQKMEAVGRLAGGVAHDFNNLLTVINGYSELILEGLSIDAPTRGPLAAILDAGDRAARLTKQLLALSRKSMVEPRLLDLNELVAESTNLLRRLIGEDITLDVLADPAPVRVVIDPGQLEQVLMNLVVNARDAMPSGGQLSIQTRMVDIDPREQPSSSDLPAGRYASLRVTDTGCGMSVEVQEKIFEPFFTTKTIGKGTGLGLAVVHGVVKQAGGTIAVESSPGNGATFTVLLPAADDAASEAVSTESHASLKGHETVLVVEDEESVRMLVKFALEGQGYTVVVASAGMEALNLMQKGERQFDLLVTDMIMPGISGRELAEEARKVLQGLRVLYMSGYTDDALGRYNLQGTSDQFIQKPFTPLGLVRKVRTCLDQSESRLLPLE